MKRHKDKIILDLTDYKYITDSKEEYGQVCNIVRFPDYDNLKSEIKKLRTELSMLVLERDELKYVECKNLEMSYMMIIGSLEYKTYEMQCRALRLKRKIEMIQAKKNRQEKIIISNIEELLDIEFEEYQKELNAQMDKMNDAINRSKSEFLSEEDSKELKKLYRRIVKSLHPDLNPELNSSQLDMFENAVCAYKNGDLYTLRIIDVMVSENVLQDTDQDVMVKLAKEKERLLHLLEEIQDSILKIKSEYPYTIKEFIQDQVKIDARKAELEDILSQYKELIRIYSKRIKEILG